MPDDRFPPPALPLPLMLLHELLNLADEAAADAAAVAAVTGGDKTDAIGDERAAPIDRLLLFSS